MVRVLSDIEQEIRALGRNDQVRLLRALLEELEALPDAMSPRVVRAQIEIDLAAANEYVARHGSFAELARE
jgi:class 3 adenylate cyclase